MSKLNDMKRKHNALQERGQAMNERLRDIYSEMMSIRRKFMESDDEEGALFQIVFGDGFLVDDECDGADSQRRHNELLERGRALHKGMECLFSTVVALRKKIEEIEGENYDPLPLIFGGGYEVYEEDE